MGAASSCLSGCTSRRRCLAHRAEGREDEARRREAALARARRLESLTAALDSAIGARVPSEAGRLLAVLQREFEGEATLLELEQRVQRCARAERDEVARRALLEAADARTRGDLEAAVVAIEQVDVRGLSREVSKLVFGRWSDACSRLAQTAGASLVRFAPAQARV